ncbi:DNA-methyltransferase [Roseomonas sp. USHLN139]|uniref:DNA-methyltransferase n=1 Tax=Roseomonas sp. USHLN139 TaxID=3081298 RepID=UPI003B020D52
MLDLALAGEQVDAVITDPPYHLTSVVKRFGKEGAAPAKHGTDGLFARQSRGFMGKEWDGGDIAFQPETWRLAFDLLKPGGHLLAFGGSRTYHRMAVAIEDAGFELRDTVMWLYGTGFPKSHDVSKGIDKMLGAEREKVAPKSVIGHQRNIGNVRPYMLDPNHMTVSDEPASPEAAQWQGWGTALKPAFEPIIVARKPLAGTVAANVLAHGTGALNIDACRVQGEDNPVKWDKPRGGIWTTDSAATGTLVENPAGRWPANVIHDGSEQVEAAFPGEAARFFYSAKASKADRADSKHPTVKPLALMRYLCRLVTPPGGTVLDPFSGSGTTLQAAMECGFNAIAIEREPEYQADIRRRIDALELESLCA